MEGKEESKSSSMYVRKVKVMEDTVKIKSSHIADRPTSPSELKKIEVAILKNVILEDESDLSNFITRVLTTYTLIPRTYQEKWSKKIADIMTYGAPESRAYMISQWFYQLTRGMYIFSSPIKTRWVACGEYVLSNYNVPSLNCMLKPIITSVRKLYMEISDQELEYIKDDGVYPSVFTLTGFHPDQEESDNVLNKTYTLTDVFLNFDRETRLIYFNIEDLERWFKDNLSSTLYFPYVNSKCSIGTDSSTTLSMIPVGILRHGDLNVTVLPNVSFRLLGTVSDGIKKEEMTTFLGLKKR